jgi:hypothetical protein
MTNARPGYGSKLFMSSTGAVGSFTPVAQLKSFIPTGSRQTLADQTNVLTPDNFTRPMAVRIDAGDIDLAGVLDPQNTQILQLGTAHASLALYFFKIVLTDGTEYDFQGLVIGYVPFSVTYDKAITFSSKIRVSGGLTGPAGIA